jgi:predicted ester cyclase
MRKSGTFCLLFIMICGTLTMASAQKKPRNERQSPETRPAEQNKLVARRVFEELTNQGHYSAADEVFDRNCKVHFGNRTVSLSQAMAEGRGWKSAAPDLFMNVENVSENGDKVTVVWSARGTHTGPGLGVRPTRRQISMRNQSTFLIKNGKIVEAWNPEYRDEVFRQLGVSKTAATMLETGMTLWATVHDLFPDPLYASLQ